MNSLLMDHWIVRSGLLLCVAGMLGLGCGDATSAALEQRDYHLRSGDEPEWEEFAASTPHGKRLDLKFSAEANSREATLLVRQQDVKYDWVVELNGKRLGTLFLAEDPLNYALAIPAGTLRQGENTLSIYPRWKENDDIVVGRFKVLPGTAKEAFGECGIEVAVTEDGERSVPCRITITDEAGSLAALLVGTNSPLKLAARPGVVYTSDGQASIGLLAGKYTVHASRGFEYGLATQSVTLKNGERAKVRLQIKREVPTEGMVSCDHHMHTLTYGKTHGDATVDERLITLAGEGIELPISTEHNVLADFAEPAKRTGVEAYLVPVLGCEVTTRMAHFNAFPISAGSKPPDHKLTNWPSLMESIRATPGVRVVVLNHPTDDHNGYVPFAWTNINPVTGENLRGPEFTFDAVELLNSGALRTDYMETYRTWFGLLNYGYRCVGVAGSDSHDVSRFIVGQGRTYIQADMSHGADGKMQINTEQAWENLLKGRASISMGLFTTIKVEGEYGPGDLVKGSGQDVHVAVQVFGPSWTSADRVALFANGVKIREETVPSTTRVEKATVNWTVARPGHDMHLVAIAMGPGVTSLHWAIPRPYQPSSTKWEPRVIGSTNPVWVDGDGDGKFTAARGYARELVQRFGAEPARLVQELGKYDEAVAAQVASLCHARGNPISEQLQNAGAQVRRGFAAFEETRKPQGK